MKKSLAALRDSVARDEFGLTKFEAHAKGICISCKLPPVITTDAGRREYKLSAVCEPCFDRLVPHE